MAINPPYLPDFVQTALPHPCPYCARPLDAAHMVNSYHRLEECVKGDSPYYCTTAEFHCVCGAVVINRFIDWQRTVYP